MPHLASIVFVHLDFYLSLAAFALPVLIGLMLCITEREMPRARETTIAMLKLRESRQPKLSIGRTQCAVAITMPSSQDANETSKERQQGRRDTSIVGKLLSISPNALY